MTRTGRIEARMEVVGSDGGHVGTVDALEPGRIRLARADDPDGSGAHHHHLPLSAVAEVSAGQVRLNLPAQQARAMAVGGLSPAAMESRTPADDEVPGTRNPGQSVSDMVGSAGGGSGHIQGGGTSSAGGGGIPHGGGTGGGGTAPGHLGSGPGIPGDPNMDPSGRGDGGR